jgi:hypothetical protein
MRTLSARPVCSREHHPDRDGYTQNHYAFDALTGFLVVLALQCAAIPLLEGRRLAIPWLISESAS